MTEAPQLSPHLERALSAFRDAGICIEDRELVWLASLRQKCDKPSDGSAPWVSGSGITRGGHTFYSLHWLAESWFWRAFSLLEGHKTLQVAAFLYAHAHSRIDDTSLRSYTSLQEIRQELEEWRETVALHDSDVKDLVDDLNRLDGQSDIVDDTDEKPEDNTESNAESSSEESHAQMDTISIMCKAFSGTTPEYWMSGISSEDARQLLEAQTDHDGWALSSQRRLAIENWLKAVKIVWRNHNAE